MIGQVIGQVIVRHRQRASVFFDFFFVGILLCGLPTHCSSLLAARSVPLLFPNLGYMELSSYAKKFNR